MDALAVLYAGELALWGIETSIIVPGAFTKGTNHFAHAGVLADKQRLAEYEAGPYKGYGGKRPFRVHIDPAQDGAEVAFGVIDRVRMESAPPGPARMSCSPRLRHR